MADGKHPATIEQSAEARNDCRQDNPDLRPDLSGANLSGATLDGVELLRNLIHERTGLFFNDYQGLDVIAGRLAHRLEKSGCGSFSDYHQLLSKGGIAAAAEWLHIAAELTKSRTSFWRQTKRTQALVNDVMPQWLSNGGAQTLRIWSAGCSTGEEPLAIAMALSEAGWFDRVQIELHASDASFVAIEKARRGIYSERGIKYLSPELRFKYFIPASEGWQVKPELHKKIQWSVTNIMSESEIAEAAASHIVFCCNVFIYFSAAAICRALRLFGERMPARGYLFIDSGDYIASLASQIGFFERQNFSAASIWMKRIGKKASI